MEVNMSLSLNNFVQLENFGHSLRAPSYCFRPTRAEEIFETFCLAEKMGLTVTARGAGKSYNDAALNGGGIVLDLSAMNQILEWDSASGVVRCEPGVTPRATVAARRAGGLVAPGRLRHDENHPGRLSRREYPRQE